MTTEFANPMPDEKEKPIVYHLGNISGFEFEDAVCRIFKRKGYDAEVAERVADLGRDVIVKSAETTIVVECKLKRSGSVGRPVVQKLHSAAVSLEGDAEGIIATTGRFSQPAIEHARGLSDVRLWNYETLVDRAEDVDIYFTSDAKDTSRVFWSGEVTVGDIESDIQNHFVGNLKSSPADVDDLFSITQIQRDFRPALLLEYELDETFGTSTYPNLYRANETGTDIEPLEGDINTDYWRDVTFSEQCPETLDGRPPAAYFGLDPSSHRDRIARRVARKASTTVQYTGKNNQTYTKTCDVEPDDVQVRSRQILLQYHRVEAASMETAMAFEIERAKSKTPQLSEATQLPLNTAVSVWDGSTGYICNECGNIESLEVDAPNRCKACDKTTCSNHHYSWPRRAPLFWAPYCGECYTEKSDPTLDEYPAGGYWAAAATSLVPGLSFLLGRRFIAGGLLTILGVLSAVATVGMASQGKPIGPGVILLGIVSGLSFLTTLYWLMRLSRHRKNLEQIEDFEDGQSTKTAD